MKTTLLWLAARLRERTTYTGLAALAALALHQSVTDADVQWYAEIGAAVAALLTVIMRENGSDKIEVKPLPPIQPAILLLAGALVLTLPGCSSVQAVYSAVTQPVSMDKVLKSALSAELAFDGVLATANAYAEQEKCGPVSKPAPFCADPATVKAMFDAGSKADIAVKAMDTAVHKTGAEATVAQAAVNTATEAIAAFKALVPGNGGVK